MVYGLPISQVETSQEVLIWKVPPTQHFHVAPLKTLRCLAYCKHSVNVNHYYYYYQRPQQFSFEYLSTQFFHLQHFNKYKSNKSMFLKSVTLITSLSCAKKFQLLPFVEQKILIVTLKTSSVQQQFPILAFLLSYTRGSQHTSASPLPANFMLWPFFGTVTLPPLRSSTEILLTNRSIFSMKLLPEAFCFPDTLDIIPFF